MLNLRGDVFYCLPEAIVQSLQRGPVSLGVSFKHRPRCGHTGSSRKNLKDKKIHIKHSDFFFSIECMLTGIKNTGICTGCLWSCSRVFCRSWSLVLSSSLRLSHLCLICSRPACVSLSAKAAGENGSVILQDDRE